jgi:CubicO group peptidase (beta-lactamase class C family)
MLDENPHLPPSLAVAPDNLGDGWCVSVPEAEGMSGEALLVTMQQIRDGLYPGVDAMVVARNGCLVAEGYFNGFGPDTRRDLRSASKSITSALTGIAISEGALAAADRVSMDAPGFERAANLDDRKRAITVRNLLDMTSGLACDDSDASSPGNEERMYPRADWVQFALDLPMLAEPGVKTAYCTAGVVLLGSIVSTRVGMGLDEYAAARLFKPLGMGDVVWRRSPDGRATGGGGLRMRPRDAAKFGEVYLDGGVWHDTPVVPEAWVEASKQTVTHIGNAGYALLWWKRTFAVRSTYEEAIYASGNGGNFVFVLPLERLVVTFAGSNYNSQLADQPMRIMAQGVLPAILSLVDRP